MIWELAARRISIESKMKKKEKGGTWGELSKFTANKRSEMMGVADRYMNDMRKDGWEHAEMESLHQHEEEQHHPKDEQERAGSDSSERWGTI